METISRLEIKVDSIRQAMLSRNLEYPWVVLFKSISSISYLPVYVSNIQAELIQKTMKIMLHEDPIPLDSLLNALDLPVEQMPKGTLESIIIEPKGENNFTACLKLKHGNNKDEIHAEIPVGNAATLSFVVKVPIYADEALLIHSDTSRGMNNWY